MVSTSAPVAVPVPVQVATTIPIANVQPPATPPPTPADLAPNTAAASVLGSTESFSGDRSCCKYYYGPNWYHITGYPPSIGFNNINMTMKNIPPNM